MTDRDTADAVNTKSGAAERVEMESALQFEPIALAFLVVHPRASGAGEEREPEIRARVDVKSAGNVSGGYVANHDVGPKLGQDSPLSDLRTNALRLDGR